MQVEDSAWCNFVWRDDVTAAIAHLLAHPPAAPVRIFNCADGHPVRASDISAALTPHVGAAESRTIRRARSTQRVLVDALLATGWTPAVPSIFHGLKRLGHDVTPPDHLLSLPRTDRHT